MSSKSRFLSIPYVVWMGIFVVVPIIMVVVHAFTNAQGSFTVDNFKGMGAYVSVFGRSFGLAIVATAVCILIGYPLAYELPAAHLRMDVHP